MSTAEVYGISRSDDWEPMYVLGSFCKESRSFDGSRVSPFEKLRMYEVILSSQELFCETLCLAAVGVDCERLKVEEDSGKFVLGSDLSPMCELLRVVEKLRQCVFESTKAETDDKVAGYRIGFEKDFSNWVPDTWAMDESGSCIPGTGYMVDGDSHDPERVTTCEERELPSLQKDVLNLVFRAFERIGFECRYLPNCQLEFSARLIKEPLIETPELIAAKSALEKMKAEAKVKANTIAQGKNRRRQN